MKTIKECKIMIVEDEVANIDILVRGLSDYEQLLTADNGEKALVLAAHEFPDLILLDVGMPCMDGFETCRRLRLNPLTNNIPIIFLTGFIGIDDKEKAFKTGAVDYITKPFDIIEVRSRVATHLELKVVQETLQKQNIILEGKINENQHTHDALIKSETRYRDLAETIDEWIWEIDCQGIFTYVSPKVKDILGYQSAELIGKSRYELTLKDDIPRLKSIFEQMTDYNGFTAVENSCLCKNGSFIVMESRGVPYFDQKGICQGYRGVDRDISERKRTESVRLHRQKIESILELASAVCQEIKQPLTHIIDYSETLKQYLAPASTGYDTIIKLRAEVEHISNLSRKLDRITSYQ